MIDPVDEALEAAWRREWSRVVGALVRFTGRVDVAEDAAQEAFAVAVRAWRATGVPENPGGWLATTARRRALDRLRRDEVGRQKLVQLAAGPTAQIEVSDYGDQREHEPVEDDQLRLIFLCCHPSLGTEAQVALTLRTVGGLSTREIAKAFLLPEATLAQRLVRAKRKIVAAQIAFALPPPDELGERLHAVRTVLYLIFNEGYGSKRGDVLVRTDLCAEAIRLTELLVELVDDDAESLGLAALMLLQSSRNRARLDRRGEMVLLADQDRTLWDRAAIERGRTLLARARTATSPGPLVLQASIAEAHAIAPSAAETDWGRIVALYDELARHDPSPVIALNGAVAVSMRDGPATALALVEGLSPELDSYYLFHSTRAELLARLGRHAEAVAGWERAIALSPSAPERAFLARQLARVGSEGPEGSAGSDPP